MDEEKLAYLAGFIIGDGNLGDGYIVRAVEESKVFMEDVFAKTFDDVFGKKPKIYFDSFNNSYVAYVHCKAIWEYLAEDVGIQTRTKSRTATVPKLIANGSERIKMQFVSGIFDAEGSVILMNDSHHRAGYLRIQFKVYSRTIAGEIASMLSSFGISNRLYEYSEFSMIQINGRARCEKFNDIVGFKHPAKDTKLRLFLQRKTRGKEFISVARLRKRSRSESEYPATGFPG